MWHFLNDKCENSHCSPEQVEEYLAGNCSGGDVSALLKLIPTSAASCSQDRQTDALNRSPFGMTLRRSTGTDGAEALTWFQGDSPVRTYRRQETGQDLTAHDLDCGPSLPGSLAKCSPPSSGWKTAQCSLFGGLTEFYGTWPRWGTMRDGELLAAIMPETQGGSGRDAGYLPSPKAQDGKKYSSGEYNQNRIAAGRGMDDLPQAAVMLFSDGDGKIGTALPEWIMDWPEGWSGLEPLATAKFRQWCASHGASSPPDFQRLETRQA